jgi:hypothetical protein
VRQIIPPNKFSYTNTTRATVSTDSVSAVSVILGLLQSEKKWKIKEVIGSYVLKRTPGENEPQHGKIQQPKRAQQFTHFSLSPYPR